ncbi:MAG: hypothetical protein AB1646_14955 [Thermodesulfobacteriota bacterium]
MDTKDPPQAERDIPPEKRLKLLSKELEDAINQFLFKVGELEKLLPMVRE